MIRPIRALAFMGLALSALGLYGCNQEEKSPVRPNVEGKGSARFALPSLPKDYLPSKGANAPAGQRALFALTVRGEGMEPIRRSWILNEGSAPTVTVDGIPAGLRVFEGRMVRIDSTGGDTTVTHEGADSAWISRDSVAEVRLFLRAGGSGRAHVCVQVEGWPSDSTCIQPPDTGTVVLDGCWRIQIAASGPGPDTLFGGELRIIQLGDTLLSTLHWDSGSTDTAIGRVFPGGPIYLGIDGGDFRFKANLDSAGTLVGGFYHQARGISGWGQAWRTSCDTISPPSFVRACFTFKQTLNSGKSASGRIGFEAWNGGWMSTYFHWDGLGSGYGYGETVYGSVDDSALVRVGVHPPTGMFPPKQKIDSVLYLMNLQPQGASIGGLFQLSGLNQGVQLGSWSGMRATCRESDFQL